LTVEAKSKIRIEIVIPVLMPSPFLDPMRRKMREIGETCRVNFVLDFSSGMINLKNEKITEIFPNERFFCGSFGSPGRARNRAIEECEGNYVCFWDVDDEPVPKELLDFVEILELSEASLGIASWSLVETPHKIRGTSPLSFVRSPGIWRLVFRREIVEHMRFTDLQWGEDQLFIAEALSKNPKIVTGAQVIYRYNPNTTNSQTSKKHYVQDLSEAIKYQLNYISEARGQIRNVLTLMIFKQLFTVLKFAGSQKAYQNLRTVVSSWKLNNAKIGQFPPSLIWRNRW